MIKLTRTIREIRVCTLCVSLENQSISTRLEEFVSDGKLSSQGTPTDSVQGERDAPKGFRLGGGRFGATTANDSDLSAFVPEDDEAVSLVAKRFRSAAAAKPGATGESLDKQLGEQKSVDFGNLEGFILDAFESKLPSATSDLPLVEIEPISVSEENGSLMAREQTRTTRKEVAGSGSVVGESAPHICPSCHGENPAGMRFCVQCGGALGGVGSKAVVHGLQQLSSIEVVPREPPPASSASRQKNPWPVQLVSINEDGTDGNVIALSYLETTVGRDGDKRFPTDAFLSPRHARLHIDQGKLLIEDLYSLNGTFLKLRQETKLSPGDTILMGRQVLRFERFEQAITPKTRSADGTRYMGSPAPGGSFKVLQIGIGGVIQNVFCLPEQGAVLGREKGDIIFQQDKFMSSRHAQIYTGDDGQCYLVDLNSSNGTWIKLWEKTPLEHKDYIFMGQQLFRVHIDKNKR